MFIRIMRTHDNPDSVDVDLEVDLDEFPGFDVDDDRHVVALEAAIIGWLEASFP